MTIYIGADHAGFEQKEFLVKYLTELDYRVEDMGAQNYVEDDDFNEYADKVVEMVLQNPVNRGILICASGEGMAMTANRYPRIRAALATTQELAKESRTDNDSNILSLSAKYCSLEENKQIVKIWLETEFSQNSRHIRRIQKMDEKWLK